MKAIRAETIVAAGLVIATAGLVGCGDGITAIEDTEFAASLGINLAAMTRTSSGLYYEDDRDRRRRPGDRRAGGTGRLYRLAGQRHPIRQRYAQLQSGSA